MKYYVVNTRVYLPEPVAEYFVKCFSLKLPSKYYDVSNIITYRDEENKVLEIIKRYIIIIRAKIR